MKEEIEFLMQHYESNYIEYDALCEFIEKNMNLDELDQLRDELELLQSDTSIDPYNYETTKQILQDNLEILITVQRFKEKALSVCYIKELYHLVFKH
jgi:predicted metal-dependent TIM-barrel fold hydrolase